MDSISVISLALIWLGVIVVWTGAFWIWRDGKRLRKRHQQLVEDYASGCAPGTHLWAARHAEPLLNRLGHEATLLNTLQCERCHEAIALNFRVSAEDGLALSIKVGPARWSPIDA